MSGIAGIVNLGGEPVEPEILRHMTGSLAFRGPDQQNVWIQGPAGFGHTLLRTTDEAEHEHQPFTLDGKVWIVADARIDARGDLIAALKAKGQEVAPGDPDVELILRAYHVWGEGCLERLLGDFAFAIWDDTRRRLFCARDHLGVKPFFYAQAGKTVVFSNTLDCERMHPSVSDSLNDLAVADFLLFGLNQELGTTIYADIQRLPPAHTASWSPDGFSLKRYWTLPIDEPIFYRRSGDYVERFRELLSQAVEERLRTNRVAVFMSGGLDSTTLAAMACSVFRKQARDFAVHAFTSVFDDYDQERRYATMVAEHLRIPLHVRVGGPDDCVDPNWHETTIHTPEPDLLPLNLVKNLTWFREVSQHSRVFFWGEGTDNALTYEWQPYLKFLVGHRRYLRVLRDISRHVIEHRRIPWLPSIPGRLRGRSDPDLKPLSFPPWLHPEFESRYALRARWADWRAKQEEVSSFHPIRPRAYESFAGTIFPALFERLDSGFTGAPLEARHPLADLRLVRYMLAVPAMPWCRVKHLQRQAMRGMLPEAVRLRQKEVLQGDPIWDTVRGSELPPAACSSRLQGYVALELLPQSAGQDRVAFGRDIAPLALDYWLKNNQKDPRVNARGKSSWQKSAQVSQ